RRDAEACLGRLPSLPPDPAFEEARALHARIAADPALAALARPASEALTRAARRRVDHHLDCARGAWEAGRPAEAMAVAERLVASLDGMPPGPAAGLRDRVRGFARGLVEGRGVRFAPLELSTNPRAEGAVPYEADLIPPIAAALADR